MADPERVENDLASAHPEWDISSFECCLWAVHRRTGVALYAPNVGALEESLAAVTLVLAVTAPPVRDVRPHLRHGVDQSFIPKGGDDFTSSAAGDPKLLNKRRLGGNGAAGGIDASLDTSAQFVGDLFPHWHVRTEVDHGKNVEDHG